MFGNFGYSTDDNKENEASRSCKFVICFSLGSPIRFPWTLKKNFALSLSLSVSL